MAAVRTAARPRLDVAARRGRGPEGGGRAWWVGGDGRALGVECPGGVSLLAAQTVTRGVGGGAARGARAQTRDARAARLAWLGWCRPAGRRGPASLMVDGTRAGRRGSGFRRGDRVWGPALHHGRQEGERDRGIWSSVLDLGTLRRFPCVGPHGLEAQSSENKRLKEVIRMYGGENSVLTKKSECGAQDQPKCDRERTKRK